MAAEFTASGVRPTSEAAPLSLAPGLLLGLGLGGFFDGIVLHQLLQWHHLVSVPYPATTVENLRFNTLWDGIFHAATYVFVVAGLVLLWRRAQARLPLGPGRALVGAALIGWGAFNLVEGVVNHAILGIHHVNERVAPSQWPWWDLGFLAWGLAMVAAGAAMRRSARP